VTPHRPSAVRWTLARTALGAAGAFLWGGAVVLVLIFAVLETAR
jgi:hypothetical protein